MKGWFKSSSDDVKQFFQTREDQLQWQKTPEQNRLQEEATNLISQGAEGKVYYSTFLGRRVVTKERVTKHYRVAALDAKLNRTRLLQETRCMVKAQQQGIDVPYVYMVDTSAYKIVMENVEGMTLKALLHADMARLDRAVKFEEKTPAPSLAVPNRNSADINLNSSSNTSTNVYSTYHLHLAACIGRAIAKLHAADIVHGDLTTSNVMIRSGSTNSNIENNDNVVIIDFGLSSVQAVPEDKAVDLYVLERAFLATHPGSDSLVQEVLTAYQNTYASECANENTDAVEASVLSAACDEVTNEPETLKRARIAAQTAITDSVPNSKAQNRSKGKGLAQNKYQQALSVLKRLEVVRMRGRKRDMFG